MGGVPPQPSGRMGVAGDLFVVRRRRCSGIASSSLLDLTSQAPSANILGFLQRGTSSRWWPRGGPLTLRPRPPTVPRPSGSGGKAGHDCPGRLSRLRSPRCPHRRAYHKKWSAKAGIGLGFWWRLPIPVVVETASLRRRCFPAAPGRGLNSRHQDALKSLKGSDCRSRSRDAEWRRRSNQGASSRRKSNLATKPVPLGLQAYKPQSRGKLPSSSARWVNLI